MKTVRFYTCLLSITLAGLLASCSWGDYYVVDFDKLPVGDSTMFRVVSRRSTDFAGGVPADCYLPDGTPLGEWQDDEPSNAPQPRRASSVSAAGLLQAL
ncbi:MAG: hypothetical protein J6W89_00930, partial [Paludibacteraceae bacterium]|nr:hypothetical protein [Paludibacteraceae bacterium]